MVSFTSLPPDILILVLEDLSAHDLFSLSLTSHALHSLIETDGWSSYLRKNSRPSYSLTQARRKWAPRISARFDADADHAWSSLNFVARPLARPWVGRLQPLLAITPTRLVVGAGSTLYFYKFGDTTEGSSPPVVQEAIIPLAEPGQRPRDITGLTFVNDDGHDRTLYVGFQDRVVERIVLVSEPSNQKSALTAVRTVIHGLSPDDFVENLTAQSDKLLSLFSEGDIFLTDISTSAHSTLSSINLGARSWTSRLCLNASTPYAAFGTSSTTPLSVYTIREDQFSDTPFAVLHTKENANLPPGQIRSTAVYGLSQAPAEFPWGSSPQVIVSGWFDGQVRCYDLRSSLRCSSNADSQKRSPTPLSPVLSLNNPWSYEPIYSVSCGGGSASYVAAGSARHSVVSFWDVRSPKSGWSVHAPGNDKSPVYSVILESSRFFGVTQSRPFVYDFGSGVTEETYPSVPKTETGSIKANGLTVSVAM
ncbi:hypothetical protein BDQ17DRAFT_1404998 [Cyathus striatus]|nr:hypothetical protein BDQ17DRAFT_1404998 [Cyathus striatus]